PPLYIYPSLTSHPFYSFFFFNAPPPTAIYTLSLHDALPISTDANAAIWLHIARLHSNTVDKDEFATNAARVSRDVWPGAVLDLRSEEHTSELQSQSNLVCRLLLEKKKKKK